LPVAISITNTDAGGLEMFLSIGAFYIRLKVRFSINKAYTDNKHADVPLRAILAR
jgi:hypothetical protein